MALRLMIVDDNPGFLHAAQALLRQEGLDVVGLASNEAEAVDRVATLKPDVTLVDIDLGGASGFALVRRLADAADLYPGALILISAHAEEDFADLITASPAIGFLAKPSISATAIERLLRGSDSGRAEAGS